MIASCLSLYLPTCGAQVFAGSDSEGNAQEALFNDLRGLVLSCVEGKNVCIFAYGQVGLS